MGGMPAARRRSGGWAGRRNENLETMREQLWSAVPGTAMKVYVATSWKNAHQPDVVAFLRGAGHEVYDFRHPEAGNDGFHWTAIDGGWRDWDAQRYLAALRHPVAERGFALDMNALRWCDACVLILPCGRSAHLEAGWVAGAGKRQI